MTFHVCIWCCDNDIVRQNDSNIKLDRFRLLCEELSKILPAPSTRHPHFDAIVLAPEYYLSKRVGPEALIIESSEAATIRNKLEKISDEFKRYLLIPGSIAFRTIRQPSGLPNNLFATRKITRDFNRLNDNVFQSGIQKRYRDPTKNKMAKRKDWTTKQEADVYKKSIVDCVQTVYATKNTAFAYLDSKEKFKVNKTCDYLETREADEAEQDKVHFFINREEKSNYTDIGGETFIFEICFDHDNAIAVETTKKRQIDEVATAAKDGRPSKNVTADYHIVFSDYVDTNINNISCKKYFMHASTVESSGHVKTPNGQDVLPSLTFDWESCPVKIYLNLS